MHKLHLLFFSFVVAIIPVSSFAESDIIKQLTQDIAKATSDAERSRLHIYRARNYNNLGNSSLAKIDYDAALTYDHKGWIHLERSQYYLQLGEYEKAQKDAIAAEKETPTLKSKAQKIIALTERFIVREKPGEDPPKEILLTKKWKAHYNPASVRTVVKKSSAQVSYAARKKKSVKRKPRRRARS